MSNRPRPSRRTVCRTLGGLLAMILSTVPAAGDSPSSRSHAAAPGPDDGSPPIRRYVAVVDRIVDGEHVVLLLEKDGDLVDQLVVSVDEFDEIAERDILFVLLVDDELLAYWHLEERPHA